MGGKKCRNHFSPSIFRLLSGAVHGKRKENPRWKIFAAREEFGVRRLDAAFDCFPLPARIPKAARRPQAKARSSPRPPDRSALRWRLRRAVLFAVPSCRISFSSEDFYRRGRQGSRRGAQRKLLFSAFLCGNLRVLCVQSEVPFFGCGFSWLCALRLCGLTRTPKQRKVGSVGSPGARASGPLWAHANP